MIHIYNKRTIYRSSILRRVHFSTLLNTFAPHRSMNSRVWTIAAAIKANLWRQNNVYLYLCICNNHQRAHILFTCRLPPPPTSKTTDVARLQRLMFWSAVCCLIYLCSVYNVHTYRNEKCSLWSFIVESFAIYACVSVYITLSRALHPDPDPIFYSLICVLCAHTITFFFFLFFFFS